MRHTGLHLVLDLFDCSSVLLDDQSRLERLLTDAAHLAGFDVLDHTAHRFARQGITLILILAQSHAALHTWPEACFAAVDFYICGPSEPARHALLTVQEHLVRGLEACSFISRVFERGRDLADREQASTDQT